MSLETYELDKKMLEYSISQFRAIPEYVKMCEAFAVGLDSIQSGVDYLSDMIDKDKAEGVWLDYIGALVGQMRSEYVDTDQFFCVNAEDVNKPKKFYFPGISSSLGNTSTLNDELFQGQINAKIAYNISNGTREDNIRIIKPLVNARQVIIKNVSPMELGITVYGENVITNNIKERIESILAPGVGISGDVIVFEVPPYNDIERQVNTIVEMTNISEVDPNYGYDEIGDDLNEILEIE